MNDDDLAGEDLAMVPVGNDFPEIREAVRAICSNYPGEYWRKLEDTGEYAKEFVAELTQAGFLSALIPEAYGGAGLPLRAGGVILEEIHASGCSGNTCHAQMYMMAMLVRYGSDDLKKRYLPGIASGEIRYQSFGVTEPQPARTRSNLKPRGSRWG